MQEPSDEDLNETVWELVVIGRGYSALVNCMTRLRCGTLPSKTLLIGRKDPWQSYVNHRMGQHAPFLALPGYHKESQPRDERFEEYLESKKFGEFNQRQLEFLLTKGISIATGVIEDALSHADGRWLVPVKREGTLVTVVSNHVDICSGPGPARLFNPNHEKLGGPWDKDIGKSFNKTRLTQLRDNVGNEALIAERFMELRVVSKKVVVVGEGPLSASAVEHALNNGAEHVVWVGRPLEMAKFSFPESTRYDDLISDGKDLRARYLSIIPQSHEIEQAYLKHATHFHQAIKPQAAKLTIALGLVNSVSENTLTIINTGKLELTSLSQNSVSSHVGSISVDYEQLVISASSENSISDVRSVAFMLQSIPKTVAPDTPFQILERLGMFVGLEVPDKSLRVLGAPSRNFELMQQCRALESPADTNYKLWVSSLSPQVKMPNDAMGITIGAATVAHANEFYNTFNPDICLQTTLLDDPELKKQRSSSLGAMIADRVERGGYESYPRHF